MFADILQRVLKQMDKILDTPPYNFIVHTSPFYDETNEYYHWHIDGGSHDFADRQLVALWYLNDVPGPGGATEFMFQDAAVQPKEGALALFPPFWTHEHRNSQLQKGVKYVATTWVSFA